MKLMPLSVISCKLPLKYVSHMFVYGVVYICHQQVSLSPGEILSARGTDFQV